MLKLVRIPQKPLAGVIHFKIDAEIIDQGAKVRFFGEMHVNGTDHTVDVTKNIPVRVHDKDPAVCFYITDDGAITSDHNAHQLFGVLAYLHGEDELHLLDHSQES